MREELDNVLQTIGAAYLTANEWCEAALVLNGRTTDRAKYQALFSILYDRGQRTDLDNLHAYYAARGLSKADLSQKEQKQGFSNIFIGRPLGD